MKQIRTFCSRRAMASGTPLAGTATEASIWLFLEVSAPWGRKALAESRLPSDVKSFLMEWESVDGRRVQFIRREINVWDAPGKITGFIARVGAGSSGRQPPELYRFRLDGYHDLLQVDWESFNKSTSKEADRLGDCSKSPLHIHSSSRPPSRDPERLAVRAGSRIKSGMTSRGFLKSLLVSRRQNFDASPYNEPLFLTCTNSRRDACCAKWGRPMAEAMAEAAGEAAWQTSHLGGHRFAPTQLVLPHGSQYGRLTPDEASALVKAHHANRLYHLDRYRGHVGFLRPVQAAEVFLREKVDCRELDALALVEAIRDGEGSWRVRFQEKDAEHELTIKQETGSPTPTSCGGAPKPNTYFVLNNYNPIS